MNRIFQQHMTELYWLAYLLTGDRERSVQAFTGALHSDSPAPAFQRFMLSWARRLVTVAALGTIRRQLREAALQTRPASKSELAGLTRLRPADLARMTKEELEEVLLAMDIFTRCAVILTILEGLSVEEAAGLLGADEKTVKAAQATGATEMTWRMAGALRAPWEMDYSTNRAALVAFG